jgi:hypothetical protein
MARMHFLRCIIAEWDVVRARLFHTRLGIWLVLLGAALVWSAQDEVTLVAAAVRTGLAGGVLCVAFAAGAARDRAALATTLGHPTSPLALAAGRWLAASVAATLPVVGVVLTLGITRGTAPRELLAGFVAGAAAATTVAGCALPGVLVGGNVFSALLLTVLVFAGTMSTTGWQFAYLWAHTLGWPVLGVGAATLVLSRRV